MQNDWKIGLVLGLVLVIVVGLWLSTGSSLSLQESPQRRTERVDNNRFSMVSKRAKLPDLTVYEQVEKIRTEKFHIVRHGETLSTISRKYYGSANRWKKILDANRNVISDANKLEPGTKLIIPE